MASNRYNLQLFLILQFHSHHNSFSYVINNGSDLFRLSFALAASKIKEKARVVAMDLRGHGKSSTDNDLDLSIEVGFLRILKQIYA